MQVTQVWSETRILHRLFLICKLLIELLQLMDSYITIREAVPQSSLSYQQISNLARKGKIKSRKSGNVWLINLESLKEHEAEMEKLGSKKHSPKH